MMPGMAYLFLMPRPRKFWFQKFGLVASVVVGAYVPFRYGCISAGVL